MVEHDAAVVLGEDGGRHRRRVRIDRQRAEVLDDDQVGTGDGGREHVGLGRTRRRPGRWRGTVARRRRGGARRRARRRRDARRNRARGAPTPTCAPRPPTPSAPPSRYESWTATGGTSRETRADRADRAECGSDRGVSALDTRETTVGGVEQRARHCIVAVTTHDRGPGHDELGGRVDVDHGDHRDAVAADPADLGAGDVDRLRRRKPLPDGVERGGGDELRARRARDRALRVPGELAARCRPGPRAPRARSPTASTLMLPTRARCLGGAAARCRRECSARWCSSCATDTMRWSSSMPNTVWATARTSRTVCFAGLLGSASTCTSIGRPDRSPTTRTAWTPVRRHSSSSRSRSSAAARLDHPRTTIRRSTSHSALVTPLIPEGLPPPPRAHSIRPTDHPAWLAATSVTRAGSPPAWEGT